MAKLTGVIKVTGKVGEMTFYQTKHGIVGRRNWGPNKKRREKDPAFKAAVGNSNEFKLCSPAAKLLRDAFADLIEGAKDSDMNTRLMKIMMAIKNQDVKSGFGKRTVATGLLYPKGAALLKGFDFNIEAKLNSILKVPVIVEPKTGAIKIAGKGIKGMMKTPKGATHVFFRGAWARIDFNKKEFETKYAKEVLLPIGAAEQALLLKPKGAPKLKGKDFYLLRVGFMEMVGGELYELKDKKWNGASLK